MEAGAVVTAETRTTWVNALWGVMLLILVQVGISPACAQSPSAPASPPPQVEQLLRLLQDPAVRDWIDRQRQAQPAPVEAAPQTEASEMMAGRVSAIREHLISLVGAVPRLPGEARQAADLLSAELQSRPLYDILWLVLGFAGLGAGLEWVFRRATSAAYERAFSHPAGSMRDRLRTIGMRLGFGLAHVAIFALGSIGAFLIFDWPPLLRKIVLAYLSAALLLRLVLLAGRILLAPRSPSRAGDGFFRVIPLTDEAAAFWHRRMALFVGWFIVGWASVESLHTLGFSPSSLRLVAYILGIGLLVIAIEAVWRSPRARTEAVDASQPPGRHHVLGTWLLSLYLVMLWGLWVAGMNGLFWLFAIAILLPKAVTVTRAAAHHLLRPEQDSEAALEPEMGALYVDRAVRALLIVGAALFLARVWQIDLVELTSRDTAATRLLRGALSSVVILLVADLIWQIVKTQIDGRLARMQIAAPPGTEEALRQARLRTLLPIFRMIAFIVLAAVALLMTLSSLGVEIAPLIAGAGIVGVAVGFGSQTLVKDVISGVFYLLDDAFRVGEYIQSGSYKGTVEKLGFRSVKLRHHRGPIYTVPYGQLGAVQNMSRDWVIDKMTINVTYDTDLDKAKKIIKQVGKELAADPDVAPNLLEPLKMQGVEQFGDFAIQLRMKMMTRPGEQFVIRRKAYAMLKKAFDENGIKFAFPTVQVTGHDESEPAAAQQALKLVKGVQPE